MLKALPIIAALMIAALPAAAQVSTTPPRPPDAPGPTIPGPRPGESLSDQLQRNDGVIAPPRNLDPEMHKAAPDTGTGSMPVIPPPGSPGGDSSVQPK